MKPKECPNCKSDMRDVSLNKVTKEEIIYFIGKIDETHQKIIALSGGEQGIRDEGGLYFSASSILNYMGRNILMPTKIGAYIFAEFARKHPFMDGNKRTSYVFAKMIMLVSRCYLKVNYKEAVPFIIKVAEYESKVKLEEIKRWFDNNSYVIKEDDIESYIKEIFNELKE